MYGSEARCRSAMAPSRTFPCTSLPPGCVWSGWRRCRQLDIRVSFKITLQWERGAFLSKLNAPASFLKAGEQADSVENGPNIVFVRLKPRESARSGLASVHRLAAAANPVLAHDPNEFGKRGVGSRSATSGGDRQLPVHWLDTGTVGRWVGARRGLRAGPGARGFGASPASCFRDAQVPRIYKEGPGAHVAFLGTGIAADRSRRRLPRIVRRESARSSPIITRCPIRGAVLGRSGPPRCLGHWHGRRPFRETGRSNIGSSCLAI